MILGKDILIYEGDPAVVIAASKSCTITNRAEALENSSPASGTARSYTVGRTDWDIVISNLVLGMKDYLLKVGSAYTLTWKVRGSSTDVMTGTAICVQADVVATNGNLVTGNFRFQGSEDNGTIVNPPTPTPGPFVTEERVIEIIESYDFPSKDWVALYGYINNGTIHLGNNSITPLTAESNLAWAKVTGTPSTLLGYGITDAYTKSEADSKFVTVAFFNRLFQAYKSSTISDANKVAANDVTTAIDNLKLMVGTWTEQYLSALGLNSSGGGGGDVSGIRVDSSTVLTPTDGVIDMINYVTTSTQRNTWNITTTNFNTLWAKVPSATFNTGNELADKSFVNSSIATATATYKGSYNLVSDLSLTTSATRTQIGTALGTAISDADNNDYCFVEIPTSDSEPTQIARVEKYKYNGSAWSYEYTLNNSGFTATQWAAVNSGITSSLVTKLSGIETGAQVNIIETIKINNTALTPSTKTVTITTGNGLQSSTNELSVKLDTNSGLSVSSAGLKLDIVNDLVTDNQYRAISAKQAKKIWDLLNQMFTLEGDGTSASPYIIKANYGLYTEQFLSALGQNTSGGGGGSGIDLDAMWGSLMNTISDTYASSKIASAHIPDMASTYGYLKSITSSMVTTALGYTPANSISLSNYLPLTGGALTGRLTVASSPTNAVDGVIDITNNTSTTTVPWGLGITVPNLPTGNFIAGVVVGKAKSEYNGGALEFYYAGAGSNQNYISLGLYEHDNLFRVYGTGNAWCGGTIESTGFKKTGGTSSQFLKADGSVDSSTYLPLSGGSMTGTLIVATAGTGNYNQGIRINRASSGAWATLLIGAVGTNSGTGTATAGDGAWLIGTPANSNSLIFSLNNASEYVGLCLKGNGTNDIKWNDNTVWHGGNSGTSSFDWDVATLSAATMVKTGLVCLKRADSASYGRISFYSSSYYTWFEYMSNPTSGTAPTGGNPSTGLYVTSWARRSLIENSSGYGWLWESCSNSSGQNPAAMMELSSNTGNLGVAGSIRAGVEVTAASDARRKTLISDTNLSVEQIANAPNVLYRWNDNRDNKVHGGSLAQYWDNGVAPWAVSKDNKGYMSLSYGALALCSAISIARGLLKVDDRVTKLEKENKKLKSKISKQQRTINELLDKVDELERKVA